MAGLVLSPHGPAGRSDDSCRYAAPVKEVQGLHAVDATIFSVVSCANADFPTLIAAEKIAEAVQ